MRDQPAATALNILIDIARGFDGQDRSYLEALGTGATGKEPALYDRLRRELGAGNDPTDVVRQLRADRMAAARAGSGAGPDGPRAISEAAARGSASRRRYARVHQRSRGVDRDGESRRGGRSAA